MSKKFASKCVLVYDYGTFTPIAERLAKDFGRVLYYSPWKGSYPQIKSTLLGYGLDGVERINQFWDYVDESDLIYFPDILDGDLQLHLQSLGKRVWGSKKGEELEIDRVGTKELMKKLKLPVNDYEVVKGLDNLRKYLKSNKDKWIKVSCFRGQFESMFAPNYKFIETKLDEIEKELGAAKYVIEFICEENLPGRVEIGYDGFSIDGEYPNKSILGIEVKDSGYLAVVKDYSKFPSFIIDFNDAISPLMKKYNYRGFWHNEMRYGKDKKAYMIDASSRQGSPPSEIMQHMITNLSDIIWDGSNGKLIDPIFEGKYALEVLIHCNWSERNWLPVQYPEKYKDNVKFRDVTRINDQYYIVPQDVGVAEIGAITISGNSIKEAQSKLEEIAEEIKAYYVEIPIDAIDKAKEEIDKLKSFGVDIFG